MSRQSPESKALDLQVRQLASDGLSVSEISVRLGLTETRVHYRLAGFTRIKRLGVSRSASREYPPEEVDRRRAGIQQFRDMLEARYGQPAREAPKPRLRMALESPV